MVKKIFIVLLVLTMFLIPATQVRAELLLDDIVKDADGFIDDGKEKSEGLIKEAPIQDLSSLIYNTLAIIGTVIAVIIGSILGWQIMTGGVEEKSQAKERLIPFGIGVVVLAGAFIIWKIVVNILQ